MRLTRLLSTLMIPSLAATGLLTWDTDGTDGPTTTSGNGTWNLSGITWNDGTASRAWQPDSDARFAPGPGVVSRVGIGGDLVAAGSVSVSGEGTTVLEGALGNLSARAVEVRTTGAGKLAVIGASSTQGALASFVVANDASLYLSGSSLATSLQVEGDGNSENRGALRLDEGSALTGPVALTGNATIGSSSTGTISGQISGAFGVSRSAVGAGTLVLGGSNTFTGGFTSTRGIVRTGQDDAFGSGPVVLAGTLTSTGTAPRAFDNAVDLTASTTFGDAAAPGALHFTGAVTIAADTTLTTVAPLHLERAALSGAVTHAGAGALEIGTIDVTADARIDGAALTIPETGLTIDTGDHTVTLNAPLSGTGRVTKTGTGVLRIVGANASSEGIDVLAGSVELFPFGPGLPDDLQVYPSGDSITFGGSAPAGYRGALASLLAPVAPGFRFVGDSRVGPGTLPAEQQNHGGHSSFSTWDIERNLDGLATETFAQYGGTDRDPHGGHWLTGLDAPLTYSVPGRGSFTYGPRAALSPDVVLLLVGANDLFRLNWDQQTDADGNVARRHYRDLLDKLTTMLPDADIFAGAVTPYNNASTSAENRRVAAYNAMIAELVAEAAAAGEKVHLVDLNTGYTGGFVDTLHPDAAGYGWMARQWQAAMMSELARPAVEPLEVNASVSSRCAGGKAVLAVKTPNLSDAPVSITYESAFGTKSFPDVQPGDNAFHAFSTRVTELPAGELTVTMTANVEGQPITTISVVESPARSCD
ncbi:hypothetical protein ESP57_17990 [Agromyces fucosus]|uniref:SGNH hydrolase-type esterase domain-containing protein n=1 Tax=Agromyces fucosus TaxID=41985 RepID=A0A4Q2JFX5_9MICO|nr:GDSL-type esterase/lipase family protein [Agromyces fucosus]RXZ46751.1 hypothetical protein ESP57_17990 [Agromyces fucosus]